MAELVAQADSYAIKAFVQISPLLSGQNFNSNNGIRCLRRCGPVVQVMAHNPTIQTYDRYPEVYDREVVEFWENFPPSFIDRFVSELPGERVLNVGSGSGRDAMLLRDKGLDVVCVDGSAAMVDMTRALGFESIQADFAELDVPAGSFDGIWAYTSLIHIPKEQAASVLRYLHSVLVPGGMLAFGAIKGDHEGMVERSSMPGEERYFKYYTDEELQELAASAGYGFVYAEDYRPHNSVYLNHLYREL